MLRSWIAFCGAILMVVGIAGLGGCKQGEGDRCQLNSDCDDNLTCCVGTTAAARALGGTCQTSTRCGQIGDVSVPVEAGTKEAGTVDKGPAKDGVIPDKPAGDKGSPDTKPTPDQRPADVSSTH